MPVRKRCLRNIYPVLPDIMSMLNIEEFFIYYNSKNIKGENVYKEIELSNVFKYRA